MRSMMSSKTMNLVGLSIFFLLTPANAFFRLLCFNPLGFGRIDPIMSPGKASVHAHVLHGSGNLGIDSVDADFLLEGNCTSCSVTVDKSVYWAPTMYFQHQDGGFDMMNTSGSITIYYKTEKRVNFEDQNYTAFPNGLKMIAGDPDKRDWVGPWPVPPQSLWTQDDTSQEALASKALGFNCLNYKGPTEATFAYGYLRNKTFIDAHCPNGIRAEVLFPSCWDGINLDSPDHKSHVVYPTLLQDGGCPKTHPVYLPILFYETIWNTQDFAGVPGQFVFSNGDPTGYGYHADFIAAWEDDFLEKVMADPDCTDHDLSHRHVDGLQEHCPTLKNYLQSQSEAAKCRLVTPEKLSKERVVGSMKFLPGNVKVVGQQHDPQENVYNANPAQSSALSASTPAVSSDSLTKTLPSQPPIVSSAGASLSSSSSSISALLSSISKLGSTAHSPKTISRYTSGGTIFEMAIFAETHTNTVVVTVAPTITATQTISITTSVTKPTTVIPSGSATQSNSKSTVARLPISSSIGAVSSPASTKASISSVASSTSVVGMNSSTKAPATGVPHPTPTPSTAPPAPTVVTQVVIETGTVTSEEPSAIATVTSTVSKFGTLTMTGSTATNARRSHVHGRVHH